MYGHSYSALRALDDELLVHFKTLRIHKGEKPVFLIEHGLDDEQLADLRRHVSSHARIAGLGYERWVGAGLPLALAITETGYRYRGTGTEFWPKFESDIGAAVTKSERAVIRTLFENLNKRLTTVSPNESDWARAFNIIAWPIRNALAPIEIHRPLAEALGRLASSGGHNLSTDEFQRKLLSIADGLWSRRLSDWLRDKDLTIDLCRNLLTGDDTAIWIEPKAAARIARDIRMDGECRQALRQARRIIRSPSSGSVGDLRPASWSACVSQTGIRLSFDHLLLRGPAASLRLREMVLAEVGPAAKVQVKGSEGHTLYLEQFLQGEAVEMRDAKNAWRSGLLSLSPTPADGSQNKILRHLTPNRPHLFYWNNGGGVLTALHSGSVISEDGFFLALSLTEDEESKPKSEVTEIHAPEGLVAWVASARAHRHLLAEAGVRIKDDRLVEFAGAAQLRIDNNRILNPSDYPVFLRACVDSLELRIGDVNAPPKRLALGDVVLIPAVSNPVTLEIEAGQRREVWLIEPVAEFRSGVFDCQTRPYKPTIDDFLSGELSFFFSSPVRLGETDLKVEIHLNGECLAASRLKITGLPDRLSCLAPQLLPLREAAFAANKSREESHWLLRLEAEGLHRFEFRLQERRGLWKHRTGTLLWVDENGAEVGPGQTAPAYSPLDFAEPASVPSTETGDVRLWLPNLNEKLALLEGVVTGEAQLFNKYRRSKVGLVSRTPNGFGSEQGVFSVCKALVAWRSAAASDIVADSRRLIIVRFLEETLASALCGEGWVKAEHSYHEAASFGALLAKEALKQNLGKGPGFPEIAPADVKTFRDFFARRLEGALPAQRQPRWTADDNLAMALDEAINQAYGDLSIHFESRGDASLEETDAGNEPDVWLKVCATAQKQYDRSPFRRLILPHTRWQTLESVRYDNLSDEDLVTLLIRCHFDISRQSGREWISSSAIRNGLMLWLSPAELLDTEDWYQHITHLLSDRHTSRAIRYVVLRSRSRQQLPYAFPTGADQ